MNARVSPVKLTVQNFKESQIKQPSKRLRPIWMQSPARLASTLRTVLHEQRNAGSCMPFFLCATIMSIIAAAAIAKEVKVTPVSPFGFALNAFCLQPSAKVPASQAPARSGSGVHPQSRFSPVPTTQAPRMGIRHLFFRTPNSAPAEILPAQLLPVRGHRNNIAFSPQSAIVFHS
jgi:hypothetical protein